MAAMYRLKGLGWLASCAVVAIGFYLISSQVAAERKRLEQVDSRIVAAQRDIRALETEFDVRANLAQLERWNGDTLALTVPTAAQFVRDEETLASLSPAVRAGGGDDAQVQTAQLIVPSSPAFAAAATPAPVPVAAPAGAAPRTTAAAVQTAAVVKDGIVKDGTVRAGIVRAGLVKVAAVRVAPAAGPAAAARPRAVKAVAMLDKTLLSDSTIGDLLSGARAERSRLR